MLCSSFCRAQFDIFEGVSKCLPAYCKDDTPNACYDDIPAEDKEAAAGYAKLMGEVALDILSGGKPAEA